MSKTGIKDGAWMSWNILLFCAHEITYTSFNINTELMQSMLGNINVKTVFLERNGGLQVDIKWHCW